MDYYFDFTVLDIETTGFDFKRDCIIEIAAIRFRAGNAGEKYSVFVHPTRKVPEFIKHLTHISDKELESGESLKQALKDLRTFLGNDLLVCHNCLFDIGFLNAKYKANEHPEIKNKLLDTLDLARIYFPNIANHKLTTVADFLGLEHVSAHRAIHDAEITGKVLIKILHYINEMIPLQLNNRIQEIAHSCKSNVINALDRVVDFQRKNVLLSKKKPRIDFHNRNYIFHKPVATKDYTIQEIFSEDGVFARKFQNYEIRQEQISMSEEVSRRLESNEFLLAEAGTGVGKSLAYLVPSVIYANRFKNKIVVSTNTKNLQEQLFYKDLPAIRDYLEIPFKATLLKGRRNYICEKKWQEMLLEATTRLNSDDARNLLNLIIWKEFTQTGDISENTSFNMDREVAFWKKLSADSLFCAGKKCPYAKQCFLIDVRKKAEESTLVIINHYLLLADIQTENSTLGEYENLIIDEAHNLPHLAPSELGLSISYSDFINFFSQIYSSKGKYQSGVVVRIKADAVKSTTDKRDRLLNKIEKFSIILEKNKDLLKEFFSRIEQEVKEKGKYRKLRIKKNEDHPFLQDNLNRIIISWQEFSAEIVDLKEIMKDIPSALFNDYDQHLENLEGIIQRTADFHDQLLSVYNANLEKNAFWMENFQTTSENYPGGILNYAPLNINQLMNDLLYSKMKTVIFTSATIAIRQVFKYYSNRMGLDMLEPGFVNELVVDSPFDYRKNSAILVAGYLPDRKDRFYLVQSTELIKQVLKAARTGTMILFTAYDDLNNVFDAINEELYADGFSVYAQGKGMSRSVMLKEFREQGNAVLLGTSSFWEGVDIPGKSLSLLILYKLPFMVPTDPVVEAYIEKIKLEGKNSFLHYMLPNALLRYRQGFGRLIRNKSDNGMVLVLDSRISTKEYGKFFTEIVPTRTTIYNSPAEVIDIISRWFRK